MMKQLPQSVRHHVLFYCVKKQNRINITAWLSAIIIKGKTEY